MCTIDQRRCFGWTKTSFCTSLTDALSEHASVQWRSLCTMSELPTATIWTQRDRLNRCLASDIPMVLIFVQWLCSNYGGFSTLYKSTPWLIYDALTHWIPEATQEKRRECFEPRDEDLELDCVPNLKNSTFASVASVLELRANWV